MGVEVRDMFGEGIHGQRRWRASKARQEEVDGECKAGNGRRRCALSGITRRRRHTLGVQFTTAINGPF